MAAVFFGGMPRFYHPVTLFSFLCSFSPTMYFNVCHSRYIIVHVAEEVLSFTRTSHPSTLQISLQHGSFGASSTISTTSSSAVIQSVATQTSLHSLNDLSINGSLTPNGPSNNNNNRNNMPTAIIVAAGTGVLNASATSGGNAVAANSLDPSRETSPVPGRLVPNFFFFV